MSHASLQQRTIDDRGMRTRFAFDEIIADICGLPWEKTDEDDVLFVAHAYYFFSIQFRENLEIACRLYPADERLSRLRAEECDTDNLSPWEGVAAPGEAMNHDEFMRRALALSPISRPQAIERAGRSYLARVRGLDDRARAKSIASYEDGGLYRVFSAILRAPVWRGESQLAFKHFLHKHIEFDAADNGGHGALSRHIPVDDSIAPLWEAFARILTTAVPRFAKDASRNQHESLL